jgi:Flp pilus assembly protein TadG
VAAIARQTWRSETGAELIEFMLVFPMLLLLVAGMVDFGMLLRTYEVVVNAAREGARVAILDGYSTADVQARVQQYLDAAGLSDTPTVTVDDVSLTTGAGTFTARKVTLTYAYNFVPLGGVAALFGGSFTTISLNGVSVMRTETQAAP